MTTQFYQGLLRKYGALDTQLKALVQTDEGAQRLEAALNNDEIHSHDRPLSENEDVILLWEMRNTMELIQRSEQALGMVDPSREISGWEQFLAALRSFFGIETNPATNSVEDLREKLRRDMEEAAKKQEEAKNQQGDSREKEKPPRRPEKAPREFIKDKAILDSEVSLENDPAVLKDFMKKKGDTLSSSTRAHMEHRISSLERIEYLRKHPTARRPVEGCTVTRDGKAVDVKDIKNGDKIMLNGVRERRSQNTMNGCWSVSLCSQMEYRGVELSQEEIRAYRPNEAEGAGGGSQAKDLYSNMKQNVHEYSGIVMRTMPNTAVCHAGIQPDNFSLETLRNTIQYSLLHENSPVSMCCRGHYRTVVGIEGDVVYFKNPMQILSDSEKIEKMTLQDIAKMSRGQVDLVWLKDVDVNNLSGEPSDPVFQNNGISYMTGKGNVIGMSQVENGIGINTEIKETVPDLERKNQVRLTYHAAMPARLTYKRLPGSNYNADVLENMAKKLEETSKDLNDIPDEVIQVSETALSLLNGIYKDTPEDGMMELAKTYLNAIRVVEDKKMAQPDERLDALSKLMKEQLLDIRKAVIRTLQGKYGPLVGDPEGKLSYGNEIVELPGRTLSKEEQVRKKNYENLTEACAGMLYLHSIEKMDLLDERWIDGLKAENHQREKEQIKQSEAFKITMNDIYADATQYKNYVSEGKKVVIARRKEEAEKKKAAATGKKADPKAKAENKKKADPKAKAEEEKKLDPEELKREEGKKRMQQRIKKMEVEHNREIEKARGDFLIQHAEEFLQGHGKFKLEDHAKATNSKEVSRQTEELWMQTDMRRELFGGNAQSLYKRYMEGMKKVEERTAIPKAPPIQYSKVQSSTKEKVNQFTKV